jgi:hypothetical protein
MNINSMRKTTVTMILGIMIGMIISNISNQFAVPVNIENEDSKNILPPVATKINKFSEFGQVIAPDLQIIEVPPPLDMNGRVPYQCYFNGQHIKLPKDVVQQIVAKHGNPSDNDPNFNVHNFIGNLKMIDLPVGSNVPTSPFPVAGRVR